MSTQIDAVTLAQDMIRCNSVTPADGGTLDVLQSSLEGLGFKCHRLTFGGDGTDEVQNLYARWGTQRPNLCFAGHTDVVPVGDAKAWTVDPFAAEIRDDQLFGRGAADMKCGTTASIFTYLYLSRLRHLLSGKLTLCVVSDEETGGYWGSDYLLREHRDQFLGDCVLNGEPSSVDTIRFGEKAPFWFRIDVRTQGGHGAYPHLSRNAIRLATELMQALYELEDTIVAMPDKVQQVLARREVAAAIEKGLGAGASEIVPRITLNIGRIEGGVKVNMAADACSFEVAFAHIWRRIFIGDVAFFGHANDRPVIKGTVERDG